MPEFAYRAMDQRGRWLRGRIRAVSEVELDQRLLDRGLDLISCKAHKPSRGFTLFGGGADVVTMKRLCIHLEQMDKAGVPLLESLAEARDSLDDPRMQDVLTEVHRDISEGMPLSQAMNNQPEVFDKVFTSLVAAGEETGNLSESFRELVKHMSWTEKMSAKIKKATRYPIILAIAVTIATIVMMVFVVPQIVELLKSLGEELPLATVLLIEVSQGFQEYWYLVIVLPVVLISTITAGRRLSADFTRRYDYLLLRIPVIGITIRKHALARFAHIFAVTFQSGIPVLGCLSASKKLVTNSALREALDVVEDRVQTGEALSEAMKTAGEFPSIVTHMVRVGENSGNLQHTLWSVAEFFDREVDEAVDAMIAMIEPTLIAVMGGLMGWIAVGVFGPLYANLGNLPM